MEKVRYLILLLVLCFLVGVVGQQPVTADAPTIDPDEVIEIEENEDNETEEDPEDETIIETDLIIFAVSAGGNNNSGELIELKKTVSDPLLLTGMVINYQNKSGTIKSVFEFSEGTIMNGDSLLFRFKNSSSGSDESADLTYSSPNLAQDGGKVSLELFGEEIDSVCWGAFPDCNGPKKFVSNPQTTLVRDLETMEFSHQENYEPEREDGREALILPGENDEGGTGDNNGGDSGDDGGEDGEEIITPVCQGLRFSEILTYFDQDRSEQFIELFNPLARNINIEGCAIRYKNKMYKLQGVVLKNSYFVVYPKDLGFVLTKNPTNSNLIELVDRDGGVVDSLIFYKGQKKSVALAQFGFSDDEEEEWRQTYKPTPGAENIYQATKTNETDEKEDEEEENEKKEPVCKGLQFSEILTYYESEKSEQFIEFYNPTASLIRLDGCSLKYKNKLYALQGVVKPEGHFVFYPSGFNLTKNPVNSNLLEIIDADESVVDSLTYYNGQKKAVAFAQFGYNKDGSELWLQTYLPTPGDDNDYQKYKTCPEGKVINEETGNCVRTVSLSTALAECPEGYYRNPLTNRCKKYTTTTSTLKECAEGYERNPLTNRCRKIVKNDGAEYEVREEKFEEKSSFVAVWAIAAVGAIGVVYVLFEYRKELAKLVKKKK